MKLMRNKDIFDEFFKPYSFSEEKAFNEDIIEKEDEYLVEISMAGFKKKNIKVSTEDDRLILNATRKPSDDLNYVYKGTYYGEYNKSFILPNDVLTEKINASYEDGLLKITIPKDLKKIKNKVIKIE